MKCNDPLLTGGTNCKEFCQLADVLDKTSKLTCIKCSPGFYSDVNFKCDRINLILKIKFIKIIKKIYIFYKKNAYFKLYNINTN